MKPPKTNIPALDEYYKTYDTQKQIAVYKQSVEFARVRENVLKYWHLMSTPKQEIEAVTPHLEDPAQIQNIVLYLNFIKQYYDLERMIKNLSYQRLETLRSLHNQGWSFDLKEFSQQSVKLMLNARRLTLKLAKLFK